MKLPAGKCAIGSRWFLKVKYNADGSLEHYKARLVAKGMAYTSSTEMEVAFSCLSLWMTLLWQHSFLVSYHHHLPLTMASPASATRKLSPPVFSLPNKKLKLTPPSPPNPGADRPVIVICGCSAGAFELLCQCNAPDRLCHICVCM
jgi:hypothetical protein